MKTIPNLGKALTILARAQVDESSLHADVDAFGAPSECHELVARGEERRFRRARKHAEAVARAPLREIERQARQRGGVVLNVNERGYRRLFGELDAKYGFPN